MIDWLQQLPEPLRAEARAELVKRDMRIRHLEELVRRMRLAKYGRKSEKLTDAQLELLDREPTVEAAEVDLEAELPQAQKEQGVGPTASRKEHPGRNELPAHLPRVVVNLVCRPEQCRCGQCGRETTVIGYEEREELDVKPAEFFVKVVRQEKRVCRHCPDEGVETAAGLGPRIREKGKLSDAFIVDVLVRKYEWHQPLYRQAAILWREAGVEVSRQTLGDAVMWVGRLLEPVGEAMRQDLLAGGYIQADETPVGVQSERVKGRNFPGYVFEYSRPYGPAVYDFRMGRGREGPREFLRDYGGVLQCDGYVGYDKVGAPGMRRAGCLAHARRYWVKAHELARSDPDPLAVIAIIRDIYAVESQAREAGLDAAGRLALRQQESVPRMARLHARIREIRQRVLAKSAVGEACDYALGQWERLEVFLSNGRVEADNNYCEQGMRPVAMGRRNWLHIGDEKAGPPIAAILSVMETCRRLQIDVRAYLLEVLPQLPDWPIRRVGELTPTTWPGRPTVAAHARKVAALGPSA
jgi:transposase